jgi:hypothetical protein
MFLKLRYTGRTLLFLLAKYFSTPKATNESTILFVFPLPVFPRKYAMSPNEGAYPYLFQNTSTAKNTSL